MGKLLSLLGERRWGDSENSQNTPHLCHYEIMEI
jgi:hypothetical protein